MGITLAILAALTWAIGDFSIERTSRKTSSLAAVLYISLFAALAYLPFAWHRIAPAFAEHTLLLLGTGAVFAFSLCFDVLALKTGKISVVEPICAFEVPITALFAFLILGERLTAYQDLLVAFMVGGIFLVSVTDFSVFKKIHTEPGAWFALVATVGMGLANFLFAQGARVTTPFVMNWSANLAVLACIGGFLLIKRRLGLSLKQASAHKGLVGVTVLADNLSWLFYTYAALYVPIAIAIGISESYIVLAAFLGFVYNKERLRPHQAIGMGMCVAAVIFLSLTVR